MKRTMFSVARMNANTTHNAMQTSGCLDHEILAAGISIAKTGTFGDGSA